MWTGKSYQEIVALCPPKAYVRGMYIKDVVAVAATLGVTFIRKRRFNIHEDDGILTLIPLPPNKIQHAVVLVNGTVMDPYNSRWWLDVDAFMRERKYRPSELLIDKGDE
jgi:hypothetical protein